MKHSLTVTSSPCFTVVWRSNSNSHFCLDPQNIKVFCVFVLLNSETSKSHRSVDWFNIDYFEFAFALDSCILKGGKKLSTLCWFYLSTQYCLCLWHLPIWSCLLVKEKPIKTDGMVHFVIRPWWRILFVFLSRMKTWMTSANPPFPHGYPDSEYFTIHNQDLTSSSSVDGTMHPFQFVYFLQSSGVPWLNCTYYIVPSKKALWHQNHESA